MAAPIPLVPPTTSAERPEKSPSELTVDTSLSGPCPPPLFGGHGDCQCGLGGPGLQPRRKPGWAPAIWR